MNIHDYYQPARVIQELPDRDNRGAEQQRTWSNASHQAKKAKITERKLQQSEQANDVICAVVNNMAPDVAIEVMRETIFGLSSLIRRHTLVSSKIEGSLVRVCSYVVFYEQH